MLRTQIVKFRLQIEPAQARSIQGVDEVRRRDENTFETFHLREHFVYLRRFPAVFAAASVLQERVGFVNEKNGLFFRGFRKRSGDTGFSAAQVAVKKVRGFLFQKRLSERFRDPGGISGFAGAGHAVKADAGGRMVL